MSGSSLLGLINRRCLIGASLLRRTSSASATSTSKRARAKMLLLWRLQPSSNPYGATSQAYCRSSPEMLVGSTPMIPIWINVRDRLVDREPKSSLPPAPTPLITEDNPVVDFSNVREAFKFKSTSELVRNYLILTICANTWIVKNADTLLKTSYRVLGTRLTEDLIRATFFRQFCSGESELDIAPRLNFLQSCGIGGILDYAAESDLPEEEEEEQQQQPATPPVAPSNTKPLPGTAGDEIPSQPARVYTYQGEERCNQQTEIFLRCIRAVRDVSPEGFAAIKITGLGDPMLLQRLSNVLLEIRRFFSRMDPDQNGHLNRERFKQGCKVFFHQSDEMAERWFNLIDTDGNGNLDYVEWTTNLRPEHIHELIKQCREIGPLSMAALSQEELKLVMDLYARVVRLCDTAAENGVRLMIDAEHSYFQPAIDHIVLDMQRRYNQEEARIFNTYQCYLKDSYERLLQDHDRAMREGWKLGAKLVRGAYLVIERQRALADPSIEDPIWPVIEQTHENYDRCVEYMLENRLPVLVATHNQRSVELAVTKMRQYGIPKRPKASEKKSGGVSFGQLLGMADHLTFSLGQAGYQAYKYVPYGPVGEVVPYLVRRAQENSGMLSGGAHERRLLGQEIKMRLGMAAK